MMKFDWYIDLHPVKEKAKNYPKDRRKMSMWPTAWPTVDEMEDFLSPMTADTILQILHGQGYNYGYECKRHTTNEIPAYDSDLIRSDKTINTVGRQKRVCDIKVHEPRKRPIKVSVPIHPFRLLKYKELEPHEKVAVRTYARVMKVTRQTAQEIVLPFFR